jgi:hypothetical protein
VGGELRPAYINFTAIIDAQAINPFDSSLLLIGTESDNLSPLGSGHII